MDGTGFYQQEHCTIYGHNVWHYLIDSPIGQVHAVQVEGKGMEITTTLVFNNNEKAERLFKRYCKELLDGKYL